CLAPEPEQRFQSAADIVAALHGDLVRTPTSPGGRTIKRPKSNRRSMVLLALGAFAIGITPIVIWAVRQGQAPPMDAPVAADSIMVAIPGGSYRIGADGKGNASPAHSVTLPDFFLDKTEVTVGAYDDFVRETNAVKPWIAMPSLRLPVTRVTWP